MLSSNLNPFLLWLGTNKMHRIWFPCSVKQQKEGEVATMAGTSVRGEFKHGKKKFDLGSGELKLVQ